MGPTFYRQPRDAGDGGQRLAAKAQCDDLLDILIRQLGRGVPLQREGDSLWRHAATIVGHLDALQPAVGQADGDVAGAGIHRVFHQLLQRGGGALHHLASGDAVNQGVWQAADGGHDWYYKHLACRRQGGSMLSPTLSTETRQSPPQWRNLLPRQTPASRAAWPMAPTQKFLR